MQMFSYDKYVISPKLCPWVEKEYIEVMNNAFFGALKKMGFKQKETLLKKVEVDFVPVNTFLAEENELPSPNFMTILVKGTINFYKRDESFYDRKNQFEN